MIKEDIRLYKLDLTGTDIHNKVSREFRSRAEVKNNHIFIPRHAPFYQESVRLYGKDGQPLTLGEDYEFYGIMGKLTQFTGKAVGLYIRLLKDEIKEWRTDYQVVGNFNKLTNETLNMLHSIHTDDRYVSWENIENKPLWFVPELHQHDLAYDIFGFTDLVQQLGRLTDIMKVQNSPFDIKIETFQNNIDVYINGFKEVLDKLVTSHENNMKDAHGVTKHHLGLGKVDNIFTATLQQAIDGLRDDLRLTPLLASQAAALAAGRNDRLFPSGALPILRYGSDTFIPPTIQGSFEGLGGTSTRCGAIIEPSGTLLMLRARNNGKVRGLYFARCENWKSQGANYEFTAYRYTHPTADAAGATLDAIINGSNKYIMVVGDSVKNMWWYCETNGTFDPASHILKPFTGPWVTEDCNYRKGAYWELPWLKATLLADENYQDFFAIMQPMLIDHYKTYRPDYYPDKSGYGAYVNYAFSFNVVANMGDVIERSTFEYTHPKSGLKTGRFWIPYELVAHEDPASASGWVIESSFAEFTPPARYSMLFRSVHATWMQTDVKGEFVLRFEQQANVTAMTGEQWGGWICWRGKLKLTKTTTGVTNQITALPGSDKLYKLDVSKMAPGNAEYDEFFINQDSDFSIILNNSDGTGSTMLAPGLIAYMDGYLNVPYPSTYALINVPWAETWQQLSVPPPSKPGGSHVYLGMQKLVVETNPVGFGSMFNASALGIADMDRPETGGVFARQIGSDGTSEWIFRPLANLNGNFAQTPPTQTDTFNGLVHSLYPLQNECYKSNMGCQINICSMITDDGQNNKDAFKYYMGANVETTLMGTYVNQTYDIPNGDGNWIQEVRTKLEAGIVNITPVIVISMLPALMRDLAAIFAPHGITADDIRRTWSIHRVICADGAVRTIMQAWKPGKPLTKICGVVVEVVGTGTPDTSNGYAHFPDCTITAYSNVVVDERDLGTVSDKVHYAEYNRTSMGNPKTFSVPYLAVDNGVPNKNGSVAFCSTGGMIDGPQGGGPFAFLYQLNWDGRSIDRFGFTWRQGWGTDQDVIPTPYYGFGNAVRSIDTFGGAAIASEVYDQSGSIFDNFYSAKFNGQRVIGMSNLLASTYTIYFQEKKNVLLGGKMYDIGAQYMDIRDFEPNPANKTFYVYLVFNGSGIGYQLSNTVIPETSTNGMIATVRCGPTQIDTIIPYNKFTMDGAQVSAARIGSAILASTGSVFDTGDTSIILRPGDFVA